MTATELTFEHIERARARIGDRVYKTPLAEGHNLSQTTGSKLFFKLENLQISGSFKERGAVNRLLLLSPDERARGVVAASAGNHAQGVALHATRLGIEAQIVMPIGTPLMKISRTRRYGAQVILHGATFDEAQAHARELCSARGMTFVHAFDDLEVMAGQGSIGLEILEQNPYIQCVVVPIGGGGLISGIAVAIKETNPKIRVIGVQTQACPSMKTALELGHPHEVEMTQTIADGIAVRRVGELTYPVVRDYVDDVVTVSEEDVANAILLLMEEEKVVAEGAGATGLAAVVAQRIPEVVGRKTAVVICGGNIDTNLISTIIERGLVSAGRRVRLEITIPDQPGSLARLTQFLGDRRANILQIHHDREFAHGALGLTDVTVTLETRGREHVEAIRAELNNEGFVVHAQPDQ